MICYTSVMPRAPAIEVEPTITLEFSVSEASVTAQILAQSGVKSADAKIAQGQSQAKFEKALTALGPRPPEEQHA